MKKLLIVFGDEGAGKSTFAKNIVRHLTNGAAFDAENVLQVKPFEYNADFINLAIKNSISLTHNFFEAGYEQVVAGSFIGNREQFDTFKSQLKYDPKIYALQLLADKSVRDQRRLSREKPTTQELMDWMDKTWPTSFSLEETAGDGAYKFLKLDNTGRTVDEEIEVVKREFPDFFE